MRWRIVVTSRAERDLKDLSARDQGRIRASIDSLAEFPTRGDLSKLQGRDNEWRLRVGGWRVRFELDRADRIIVVLRILPRGRAYRQ
jgi:mRNA interferase RelE/StbE